MDWMKCPVSLSSRWLILTIGFFLRFSLNIDLFHEEIDLSASVVAPKFQPSYLAWCDSASSRYSVCVEQAWMIFAFAQLLCSNNFARKFGQR